MTKPARRRSEPTCSHCENEEDLTEWADGRLYCPSCLHCEHIVQDAGAPVCLDCLRRLYSVVTFEGWRIRDMLLYVLDSFNDYGVDPDDLTVWTYDEQEMLGRAKAVFREAQLRRSSRWTVTKPPPHLRFTSKRAREAPH